MTPRDFVIALKQSVRQSAENEADYYADPPSGHPPDHLARFGECYRRLTPVDQEGVLQMILFAAEGSLFSLLTQLDNLAYLTDERGALELYHVSEAGARTA